MPCVRISATRIASPRLASHAPNVIKTKTKNVSREIIDDPHIKMNNLSIMASSLKSILKRCLYWSISVIIADQKQVIPQRNRTEKIVINNGKAI